MCSAVFQSGYLSGKMMIHCGASCALLLLSLLVFTRGLQYRSNLDNQLSHPYSFLKSIVINITAEKKGLNRIYRASRKSGKIQPRIPASQIFFCDAKKGPGARSESPPVSVNKVRPGDIDVIAAIGDSLTAANGAISIDLFDLVNENRGLSFSIGGRGEWRKYLTLPNILREFNPGLYGYSDDSVSTSRASKFNVADPIAYYEDMLLQAKNLLKRMKGDPLVNMKTHWKLITIFMGSNDICSRLCEMPEPLDIIKEHVNYTYMTLRYLRNNFDRTLVNWVLLPNLTRLRTIKNIPLQCYIAKSVECRCIYSPFTTENKLRIYENIIQQMQRAQIDVIKQDEFHTNTFTVNLQPFAYNITFPLLSNGNTDLRLFASDCFHFSQLGHATVTNALWNNMMQPDGKKQIDWTPLFKRFECPTNENPFISTRGNTS